MTNRELLAELELLVDEAKGRVENYTGIDLDEDTEDEGIAFAERLRRLARRLDEPARRTIDSLAERN